MDVITAGVQRISFAQHVSMARVSLSFAPSLLLQPHRRTYPAPQRTAAASSTDCVSTATSASTPNLAPKVVVTRERGKNAKLITALVGIHSHTLTAAFSHFIIHCHARDLFILHCYSYIVLDSEGSKSKLCYVDRCDIFILVVMLPFPRFLFDLV